MKPSLDTYAELLKQGSIVAFPTETVYGLGASAWNPMAIGRVFEAKKRPADNPLIVHVSSIAMLNEFVEEIPDNARLLMQKFWPGPLTLIFRKKKKVLDLITGGLDTVAIRMPAHPVALRLIDLAGPLVAPSANTSGRPSPTHPDHVRHDFGNSLPVIEGGQCEIGLESTVLDLTAVVPEILRPGFITPKAIAQQTGIHVVMAEYKPDEAPKSPGVKYSHYSPNAAVRWMKADESAFNRDTLYLLHDNKPGSGASAARMIHFYGDYRRMGRELYDWFRKADHEGYSHIAIEPFNDENPDELIATLRNRIDKATSTPR
ncbi:MAG: threonylcarbamoyl-AMP synthase [Rhodothermaceae bacterium]|nr:threonylcarbamoyl-AMP synthase [Rhodothermaceae bacterium]